MIRNKDEIAEKEKLQKVAKEDMEKFEGINKGTKLKNTISKLEKTMEGANKKLAQIQKRIDDKYRTKVQTKEDKLKSL